MFRITDYFLGGGKLSSSGYLWPILIGVFVVAHVWMMFKGHGGHSDANIEEKSDLPAEALAQAGAASAKQSKTKGEHKHGGCCH